MIQILSLLGMYFDAVVVEVKTFLLLFKLTLALLSWKTILLFALQVDFWNSLKEEKNISSAVIVIKFAIKLLRRLAS